MIQDYWGLTHPSVSSVKQENKFLSQMAKKKYCPVYEFGYVSRWTNLGSWLNQATNSLPKCKCESSVLGCASR